MAKLMTVWISFFRGFPLGSRHSSGEQNVGNVNVRAQKRERGFHKEGKPRGGFTALTLLNYCFVSFFSS